MLGDEGGQGLGPGTTSVCLPGGALRVHCSMENRIRTWEVVALGQVLLLLIRFVTWGIWPHHSERLCFFKGRVRFCGI